MLEWISNFAGALLNTVMSVLFVSIVTSKKYCIKTIYFVFIILLMSVIILFLNYLDMYLLKSFIIIFMVAFLYKCVYSIELNKVVILSFLYFLLVLLVDIFSTKLLAFIFGSKIFYEVIAGSLIGSLVVTIIFLSVVFILRGLINKFLNVRMKYRLIFISIFSLLCVTAIYYATYRYGTKPFDNLIGFLYIIVVVIILLNSFVQEYKNNQLTLEYDNLLEFIKKYEVEIDSQRILRHESKNQLLIIKAKIIDNDTNEAIIDYIDEVLNDHRRINQIEYAKFAYLPSNGIKGLFYFKVAAAQEKNIRVELNISNKIEESFLDKLSSNTFNQLGKILGVFLDNAIEGAETSQKKAMVIEIIMKENDVLFVISNSFNSRLKENDRSTKGVGRGYGLLLVNSILISNKKFETDTEIIDDFYVKKLLVKE